MLRILNSIPSFLSIFGEKVTCPKYGKDYMLLIIKWCGSHKPLNLKPKCSVSLGHTIVDYFYCHIFNFWIFKKIIYYFLNHKKNRVVGKSCHTNRMLWIFPVRMDILETGHSIDIWTFTDVKFFFKLNYNVYILKSIYHKLQFNDFSQIEHTHVTNTQIKN